MRIENIGSAPIEIPFSPHLADLQPEDASQKFRYSELSVDLWIGGVTWSANTAATVILYGANTNADKMLTLRPREWTLVIGKGKITLPENVVAFIRNGI